MKLGMVIPNPLAPSLAEAPRAAEAGAKGLLARPEVFVDSAFALKVGPDEMAAALRELPLVGLWPRSSLLGPDGVAQMQSCIDLADALREFAPPDTMPLVVCDAGGGDRETAWPRLVEALQGLARAAEERSCILAVRPDRASIVDRSRSAAKLLAEVGSSYVQTAVDPAATVGDKDTLDDAVLRLKDNIVLAFARDVKFDQTGKPTYLPPGSGVLSYAKYAELLAGAGACGYLVLGELATIDELKAAASRVRSHIGA